jgi:hypothetical protein
MKKLLKASTIALILFSFIATSCEKENPGAAAPVPAPVPMTLEATTTFTPTGETKAKVVKGDLDGERGIAYHIVPKIVACNCNGVWSYDITTPNHSSFSKDQDKTTGVVGFMTMSGGTYKIVITYTCPGAPAISVTVNITVK